MQTCSARRRQNPVLRYRVPLMTCVQGDYPLLVLWLLTRVFLWQSMPDMAHPWLFFPHCSGWGSAFSPGGHKAGLAGAGTSPGCLAETHAHLHRACRLSGGQRRLREHILAYWGRKLLAGQRGTRPQNMPCRRVACTKPARADWRSTGSVRISPLIATSTRTTVPAPCRQRRS